MLLGFQKSFEPAVESMNLSNAYAQKSMQSIGKSNETFKSIHSKISSVVDMSVQISAATEQQTMVMLAADLNGLASGFKCE